MLNTSWGCIAHMVGCFVGLWVSVAKLICRSSPVGVLATKEISARVSHSYLDVHVLYSPCVSAIIGVAFYELACLFRWPEWSDVAACVAKSSSGTSGVFEPFLGHCYLCCGAWCL